jgi:hypothetical protein
MSTPETAIPDRAPRQRWHEWFDARFRTPVAIYGLIVYTSLLMIMSDDGDVPDTVADSVVTLLIFFLAHVFAQTLSDHGAHPLGRAIRHGFSHSAGMLYAAVPPTLVMLVAGAQGSDADDATFFAVCTTMLVLAFLGYVAYMRTGAAQWVRILGAIATALLGAFMAVLEYVIH